MRVFVAGASGAIGRALIPQLVVAGHEVVGMTRSSEKRDMLRGLGARPVVADALDPDQVAQAVASAEPEVIVHELTALSGKMSMREARHPERSPLFTLTCRLRSEGTDHLLAAGQAVGARRFVAFLFTGSEASVVTEDDPNDINGPVPRAGLEALAHLERAVTSIEWGQGVVLRYGGFYGPGTGISSAPDASMAAPVRRRRVPIIGDGGGVFSHVHIADAAAATVIAVERGRTGVYNIVDDEPAPASEWLPALASALGAKPPRHLPAWLARLAAGAAITATMTRAQGSSNSKARRELGWQPRYCSSRQGFREGL